MAFDDDVKITINLNKLVDARARILTQYEDFSKAVVTGESILMRMMLIELQLI